MNITNWNSGYRISIGDHNPVIAHDLVQLTKAVDHFFAGDHIFEHDCPFCYVRRFEEKAIA